MAGGGRKVASGRWQVAGGPVEEALESGAIVLESAGIETPRLDVELLLAHCLGVERTWLLAHPEHLPEPAQLAQFWALVERRAKREPLAYLTGTRWFYGLEFEVNPSVLIPRPETEMLVEYTISKSETRNPKSSIIDVGTGSGAIAVSVAVHISADVRIYASDISAEALKVARRNAERHGVADRIIFLQGDLLAPLPEPVDMIVANLPYVAERERPELMPEVRVYEPPSALFAGPRGLDLLERLLAQTPAHLRPGGVLSLEIGYQQGEAVQALAERHFPHADITIVPDLAGLDRMVVLSF